MYSVRVCTTDDRELPAPDLGLGLTWDRLTDVLRREVSPAAAEIFAEPIRDEARGDTHWHVSATGDPTAVAEMSEPARSAALELLTQRRREILDYANRLHATGGESNARMAAALRLVVRTPDDQRHIWIVDGKPVLTAWGRNVADAAPPSATISKRTASAPHAPSGVPGIGGGARPKRILSASVVSPILKRRPRSLLAVLWALFAGIVATILIHLLPACKIDLPLLGGLTDYCGRAERLDLGTLREHNSALRAAILTAEREIEINRGNCTPSDGLNRSGDLDRDRPSAREAEERRREAEGTHGKLDITLVWNGREDLDLHVSCPGGRIYYSDREACGGLLEVDRNSRKEMAVDNPVEHVSWSGEPPAGEYRVEVVLFDRFDLPARIVPFTVVVQDGNNVEEFPGQVDQPKVAVPVTSFRR